MFEVLNSVSEWMMVIWNTGRLSFLNGNKPSEAIEAHISE